MHSGDPSSWSRVLHVIVAIFFLEAPVQDPPRTMGLIAGDLSSESLETRARAQVELEERWREWSNDELACLRVRCQATDAEAATRAKAALTWIEVRRQFLEIPDNLWRTYPDLRNLLANGDPRKIGDMLLDLDRRYQAGELAPREVIPVAIEFMDDTRDTRIDTGSSSIGKEGTLAIESLAHSIIWKVAPVLAGFKSRPERLAWWKESRDKREVDWNLQGLRDSSPRIRAESIRKLAKVMDAHLYPLLFRTLDQIDDDLAFEMALRGLREVPAETLVPHLRKLISAGPLKRRMAAVSQSFADGDPRIDEVLIEAFDCPEQDFSTITWHGGVLIGWPRLCDLAGICMSFRLKIQHEYEWPNILRIRDANLEDIRNRWRSARGLPGTPFLGPGVRPVVSESVDSLIPDLMHPSDEKRKLAVKDLCQLGPGAWKRVQARIDDVAETSRPILRAAVLSWANCLQVVTSGSEAASAYVAKLQAGRHLPFEVDAFVREVADAWFCGGQHSKLTISLSRAGDVRGIYVDLHVEDCEGRSDGGRRVLSYGSPGRGTLMGIDWSNERFHMEMAKDMLELKSAMGSNDERQVHLVWSLHKIGWK